MIDQIRRLFVGPEFQDPEKTRVARLLTVILWFALLTAATALILSTTSLGDVLFPGERALPTGLSAGLLVVTVLLQWVVHRGCRHTSPVRVRIAAGVLLITLWLVVTLWLWLASGISGSWLVYAYPLILVFAGMLLGGQSAAAFMVLSIVGMVGAYIAERSGQLSTDLSPTSLADLGLVSFLLTVLTVVLIRGQRNMMQAVRAARQSAAENITASEGERISCQLETVQASVEHRVAERTKELSVTMTALQAVAEIGRAAVSAEGVDALVSGVAPLIADRFGCYHVGIYLVDDSGGTHHRVGDERSDCAVLKARGGPGGEGVPDLGYEIPAVHTTAMEDGSVITEAVQDQALKLAFGSDVPRTAVALAQDALSTHSARLPETAVEVVIPLVAGDAGAGSDQRIHRGAAIGVVDMHIADLSTFYQQSLEPLRIMADQLAVAVVAARRLEQSQSAIQAERDTHTQIDREGWVRLVESGVVPGYRFHGHRVEPIGDLWYPEMRAALLLDSRVVTSVADAIVSRPPPDPTIGDELENVDDVDVEVGVSDEERVVSTSGAVAAVPLRVRDQTIGVLHVKKRHEAGDWNARELELLDSLKDQLEAALESARLYRETQQAAVQQRTIAEVSSHIREEVDIESVLARALAELGGALAADQGAVLLTLEDAPDAGDAGTHHRGEETS
ncbi:MAG: hypothetical protein JXC32_18525 [Anaerolineae bacterium]|nr:hypothetical protein [Anaerolineae bacterium]